MIVLGIANEHCSSAALMVDGQIVGMIQEERLTRRKNDVAFPLNAIRGLIARHLEGDARRIDQVVIAGRESDPYCALIDRFSDFSVVDHVREQHEHWYPYFYGNQPDDDRYWKEQIAAGRKLVVNPGYDFSWLASMTREAATKYFVEHERPQAIRRHLGFDVPIDAIDHHTCHGYYALLGARRPQDAQRALVLTADGWGDGCNWAAFTSEDGRNLTKVASGQDHSVARIYKWATLILGMKPNEHEYKVMGLASYSRSRKHIADAERILFEALDFRDGAFVRDRPLTDSYFDLKQRLEGHRFDNIAAALQNWATQLTCAWAKFWLGKTGRDVLCFSGGLSMNIKINAELLRLPEVRWLSVPASGGDESLSAGACFAYANALGTSIEGIEHVYLGEDAASDPDAWQGRFAEAGLAASDFAVREGVTTEAVARLLAADCVIARCVGHSEFGARALGNRSILANPSNPENMKFVNDAIKNRDFWMPFTPSILAEYTDQYLDNPKHVPSPFMTIGFPSKPETRKSIAAALHPADYSARPQFVDKQSNPDYWALIDAFRGLTGVPALLNTSLNLHGEPMNYSTADAARTVGLSELDFLLLPGDRLLYKKRAENRLGSVLGESSGAG